MSKQPKTELKPIDTPVYSYWEALYKSFFSRQLYVDVGKRWKGMGFYYLVLMVAIFIIPLCIKVAGNFNRAFNTEIADPLAALPVLYVQNGQLTIDQPVPFLIKNKRGDVVLLVDTSGKITDFTPEFPNLYILITNDKIALRMPTLQIFHNNDKPLNNGVPKVISFDKTMNSVFDGKQFIKQPGIVLLRIFSQVIIYPIFWLAITIALFTLFLIVGMLGQLFANVLLGFNIRYIVAIRMLIVSATPMILLLLTAMTFEITFRGMGLILISILGFYFYCGLFALKRESLKVAKR